MTQVLLEKAFPMTELRLLASERSAGRRIAVGGRDLEVELATPDAFEGVDIALFSAGGGTSKQLAPEAAARGAAVIDNSSAWRMDPDVPLVVSQVNPDDLAWHEGIIANPNCSTMQLVPPLMALRDAVGLERIVVDTYQSVAGTGHKAIVELEEQVKAHAEGRPKVASVYPHPIAFNALPHIDVFLDNGYTNEEWKVVTESRKILHLPDLRVSCTAVRVPVFVSHSEAVHVETQPADHAGRGTRAVRGRQGRRRAGRSRRERIPAGRDRRRVGRRVRRPGPPGPVDRRQPRPRVLGRVRQPAQGRGVQRRRDRRDPGRARLGPPGERSRRRCRERRSVGSRRRAGTGRGVRGTNRVTRAERQVALEAIATEVRACTRCRLHEGRTKAVPGEGDPDTEVVFVGEGPGFNEDREGRPFVGRAGGLLVQLLGSIGWQRDDVFITNVVKCRPPDNRDPQPDEIAACAPFLRRQLETLDPAVVVTLGRYSMGTFMPGARIGQVHGTTAPDRSRAGADQRARVRDVPPGGGAAHARRSSARATRTSRSSRTC